MNRPFLARFQHIGEPFPSQLSIHKYVSDWISATRSRFDLRIGKQEYSLRHLHLERLLAIVTAYRLDFHSSPSNSNRSINLRTQSCDLPHHRQVIVQVSFHDKQVIPIDMHMPGRVVAFPGDKNISTTANLPDSIVLPV